MKKTIATVLAAFALLTQAPAQNTINILYNGTTAKVTIPKTITDVTSSVNGAHVTITAAQDPEDDKEYTYRVKGKSTDGSLTLVQDANHKHKLTLQLDGVTLTSTKGAAIDIQCKKRIAVELVDRTVNTLADATSGAQKAALNFMGHAEFEGGGTLNVTGNTKHAINAKEYIELKKTTGTINILGAVSDGIHCGKNEPGQNYFEMKGGTVNIQNVGGDGIDTDDFGVVNIKDGAVSINLSGNSKEALKADSTVKIKSGLVNIVVTGQDSKAIRACDSVIISGGQVFVNIEGDGSKAIKAKYDTRVKGAAAVSISDGTTNIMQRAATYTVANATDNSDDTARCMGISADGDLIQTGGTATIIATGGDAYPCVVKGVEQLRGGTMTQTVVPWKVSTDSYQYDMTAYVKVTASKVALTDYSQVAVGAFIGNNCVGYGVFESAAYGIIRLRNSSATKSAITFKLYDRATRQEYTLTPSSAVTFASTGIVGTPSAPLTLNYAKSSQDGDTKVTIGNVGVAGFSSNKDLDFSKVSGLSAWIATGFSNGNILLSRVQTVSAGTGVYLKADKAGTFTVPTTTEEPYYENFFRSVVRTATIPQFEYVAGTNCQTLSFATSQTTGKPAFFPNTANKTYKDNKMYLCLPASMIDAPTTGNATGATIDVKVTSVGVAGFSCNENLDFSKVSGLSAWIATGYRGGNILLSRVNIVPAGTGIYVKANKAGTFKVPVTTAQACYKNMFVGVPNGATVGQYEFVDGTPYSTLSFATSQTTGKPAFFPNTGEKKYAAGKMYLRMPSTLLTSTASARGLGLEFLDTEETYDLQMDDLPFSTDISDAMQRMVVDGEDQPTDIMDKHSGIYDLQGRRVSSAEVNSCVPSDAGNQKSGASLSGSRSSLKKGVYIIDSHKVVIK